MQKETIIITGGAGFIGSSLINFALEKYQVVVVDKLTYAGHLINLKEHQGRPDFFFERGGIEDEAFIESVFHKYSPKAFLNLAAETHVDRSILASDSFIQTNVIGTHVLLKRADHYFHSSRNTWKERFRFLQVSTDEVFGSLGSEGHFDEDSPYAPNSPYSASKAAGDHLVRAWNKTYNLPTVLTNCSNNYGPRQTPEKLIPVVVQKCLQEKSIPVYGNGENVRDWIYVDDHCRGILMALERGKAGQSYCFGGATEIPNIQLVQTLCRIMDQEKPLDSKRSHAELITFVPDRAGHDYRYAIDGSKAEKDLGFENQTCFEDGIKKTIQWYLKNPDWITTVMEKL